MLLGQVDDFVRLAVARARRRARKGTTNATVSGIGCIYLEGLEFINKVPRCAVKSGSLLHGTLSILVHSVPGT